MAEGEIVSGRVTDPFGNPVVGATVAATVSRGLNKYYSKYTTNVTTSATGVYSIIIPADCTTTLKASLDSNTWATTNTLITATTASVSPISVDFEEWEYSYNGSGPSIGNSWGNDLVLVQTNVVAASEIGFSPATGESSADDGFSLSFNGPSGAWYTVLRSELLPPDWTVYTNIQVSATGEGSVVLPMDSSTNSCFYCITPRNMIQ